MTSDSTGSLAAIATETIHTLCTGIGERCVGSAGNREATARVEGWFAALGWQTARQEFACVDWTSSGATLAVGGESFDVRPGPYSPGCEADAPLVVCSTVEEVEALREPDCVLLLRGAVAREQLFPKNYPFVSFDEHQRIYRAVEDARPAAVVGATARSPSMAGAVYPAPLFEDGDFGIPSIYLTEEEGLRLAAFAGEQVALRIDAARTHATGWNPVASQGNPHGRLVVLFAHIDAKRGTPGALDNAAGVATLMLLARLLAGQVHNLQVQMVALNGEDHYSAIGEMTWLQSRGSLENILLGINVDGAGYRPAASAWSTYGCPPTIQEVIESVIARRPALVAGEPWYQSDHSLFVQNSVPALAFTTSAFSQAWSEIAHTERDTPEVVDVAQLVDVAEAIAELILELDAAAGADAEADAEGSGVE